MSKPRIDAEAESKGRAPAREAEPLPTGVDALLGKAQLCIALGTSLRKLQGMIAAGEFPQPDFRVGQNTRWTVSTFNAWVAARKAAGPNRSDATARPGKR